MACPVCNQAVGKELGAVGGRDARYFECLSCGRFGLDNLAGLRLAQVPRERRYLLAYWCRSAGPEAPYFITEETIDEALKAALPWGDPFANVDRALLLLAGRATGLRTPIDLTAEWGYPLIPVAGADALIDLLGFCAELGYLRDLGGAQYQLKSDGWRRVMELRVSEVSSRRVFVAMWFSPELRAAYDYGIRPAIEIGGHFEAYRVDDDEFIGMIDDRVLAGIRGSGAMVADLTGHRGSVYFEFGYAMGLGIPVITTCHADEVKDLRFDVRNYNTIEWRTPGELQTKLTNRIAATLLPRTALVASGFKPS